MIEIKKKDIATDVTLFEGDSPSIQYAYTATNGGEKLAYGQFTLDMASGEVSLIALEVFPRGDAAIAEAVVLAGFAAGESSGAKVGCLHPQVDLPKQFRLRGREAVAGAAFPLDELFKPCTAV